MLLYWYFSTLPFEGRIRLLDVGSCYNPFEQFDEFQAIGVDISPAVEVSFNKYKLKKMYNSLKVITPLKESLYHVELHYKQGCLLDVSYNHLAVCVYRAYTAVTSWT